MTESPGTIPTAPGVVIDCFASSVDRYRDGFTLVAVDVIRATTTAVTAVVEGRRCIPVCSTADAAVRAATLDRPILAGELHGDRLGAFDIGNSPSQLVALRDRQRPVVLLSTSGTELMCATADAGDAYVACLRNWSATAAHLVGRAERVAVIGAGSRGEFREEDQLACAWIAGALIGQGYRALDDQTAAIIDQWCDAAVDAALQGNSEAYLRRSGQEDDLDFVATHIDDVPSAFVMQDGEVVRLPVEERRVIDQAG